MNLPTVPPVTTIPALPESRLAVERESIPLKTELLQRLLGALTPTESTLVEQSSYYKVQLERLSLGLAMHARHAEKMTSICPSPDSHRSAETYG